MARLRPLMSRIRLAWPVSRMPITAPITVAHAHEGKFALGAPVAPASSRICSGVMPRVAAATSGMMTLARSARMRLPSSRARSATEPLLSRDGVVEAAEIHFVGLKGHNAVSTWVRPFQVTGIWLTPSRAA